VADADPDAILAAVTPRTRPARDLAGAMDERPRPSGSRAAEAVGVPILVDGAQSVGAIPVDANGLDFVTISGQKWLCGPDATGALVVADPEQLRVARPSYFSQSSYESSGTSSPRRRRPLRSRLDPAREPRGLPHCL
jgi:L-cysteine/cystine lyase